MRGGRRREDKPREYTIASARKKALDLLLHMDRTEQGLRDKLKQNGVSEELIEDAIAYVKELHYIDDRRYAQYYIELHRKEKSARFLKMELQKRGVNQELLSEVMEGHDLEDESEAILKIIEKRCRNQEKLDDSFYRKLWGYLMRRGFQADRIRSELESYREIKDE